MKNTKVKQTGITTELIEDMRPCRDRLDNWKEHYNKLEWVSYLEFSQLPKITHRDKVWVLLRLLSRTSIEVFAIESAISAQQYAAAYADAAYAAYAAAAYAYAAYAAAAYADAAYADAADARSKEEEYQLKSLLYLLENDDA